MKIALVSENPIGINGVKEAFEEFFPNQKGMVNVTHLALTSNKEREKIEGEVFKEADNKMRDLRRSVKDEYDYFVILEDGLFSKGGMFFYSQVAHIQSNNARTIKLYGISSGIMIPYGKDTEVIDEGFTNVFTDENIQQATRNKISLKILTKQAVITALANSIL